MNPHRSHPPGSGKQRQVSTEIFCSFAALFIVFSLVVMAISIPLMVHTISRDILDTQMHTAQTISQSIEQYFAPMDAFSRQLMNSDSFKQAVIRDIPLALRRGWPTTAPLNTACSEAYQMYEKGYRLGIATQDQTYIWLGDKILTEPFSQLPPSYADYDGYGAPVLCCVPSHPILAQLPHGSSSRYADSPMIILARSISLSNYFHMPQAMLEVCLDLRDFTSYMEGLIGSSQLEQLQLTVYGSDGSVLYGEDLVPTVSREELGQWLHRDSYRVRLDSFFDNSALVFYRIPDTIYTHRLLAALGLYLLAGSIMLGCLFLISYLLAKKLTRPMGQLCSQLEHLSLTEPAPLPPLDTRLYELNVISQTVQDLQQTLSSSLQENLMIQTSELQSRLMAMQSQMQPHFLYNTLSMISSLSEQGQQQAVSRVCLNLTQMLRYVSTEEHSVLLYDEISFLKSYVTIMTERFPQAKVHTNFPLDMMDLQIPKLVLQPLCENSFKHANRKDVEIWIDGDLTDHAWRVTIRDNGPGFSAEQIQVLLDRCRRALAQQEVLSTKVEGMGLVNIYARLSLFYHGDFQFSLDETTGITIGGQILAD